MVSPASPTAPVVPTTTKEGDVEKDEWGNIIHRDASGNITGVDLFDLKSTVTAKGYEAYRFAKGEVVGEEQAGAASRFYGELTGATPTEPEERGPLPPGAEPWMFSEEFAMAPGSVQSYVMGQHKEATGTGAAVTPPLLSPNEERMLIDLQNSIEIGKMDEGQAWDIIANYWSKEETQTRRAEDATRRGGALLAGAHAGPNLPMTGPGGMGAGLQQKYGLPNLTPGVQGLPGAQALGVFGQAQQQLGLPAQLPPLEPPQFQLPNWQAVGQGMPNFGGTNYFEQLLQEGRMTAPGL